MRLANERFEKIYSPNPTTIDTTIRTWYLDYRNKCDAVLILIGTEVLEDVDCY